MHRRRHATGSLLSSRTGPAPIDTSAFPALRRRDGLRRARLRRRPLQAAVPTPRGRQMIIRTRDRAAVKPAPIGSGAQVNPIRRRATATRPDRVRRTGRQCDTPEAFRLQSGYQLDGHHALPVVYRAEMPVRRRGYGHPVNRDSRADRRLFAR